jgi:hypothetical protein
MSHTLHEAQKAVKKRNSKSRSVPLIGRDTIADYGMQCDVLRWCCVASSPVQSMHLHDRREALYFRGKPELNHGSTGLSYTNGGWNNREWLDEDK